ncbi:mannose-6-phosphate isomerase, class I [Heyndrickxia coagulans]|uniref:Mannose-6-phosphate isomerase n=1 Tax=Heyndrickxia coagulans TaxID=1398 RepID=A0AAW7CHM5_HEYCO|nr:mannose-6-phosphate isomerase, class I [Heyndrickxia coagulans]MDL5040036.1 mannose-6-phosphate isomerase, class I [Heyndrickxia coagulans]
MTEPLFLEPVFKERIWGGTALRDRFGYHIPSDHTGECWAISGHPNGPSSVKSGEFAGKTLMELWEERRDVFGGMSGKGFPLLTKILDANADLSVQVHPDDAYANEHENGELGKTECWYIIDCKKGAQLVYGHHAKTKEEFVRLVEEGKWDSLLRKVPIHPGDFFYVPSGTIHALCEGTLVLETQQSSDTTYRVYDYDRTDAAGNKRELHLQKAIDVTMIPHRDAAVRPRTEEKPGVTITTFAKEAFFSVYKWDVEGTALFTQNEPFELASVLDGEGAMKAGGKTYPLEKGMHFLLPSGFGNFELEGRLTLIVSHP